MDFPAMSSVVADNYLINAARGFQVAGIHVLHAFPATDTDNWTVGISVDDIGDNRIH